MTLTFLADEDFDHDILRALARELPGIDITTVQAEGLSGQPDPIVLERAAVDGRVVLSHDRKTMGPYAWDRVRTGEPMPGLIIVSHNCPISQLIVDIAIIMARAPTDPLDSRVVYVPL